MRYMLIMPFIEASEEKPEVLVDFIEADTDAEAKQVVTELATNARKLMNEFVDGWMDCEELRDIDGADLLSQYGIGFGVFEGVAGYRAVAWVGTPFAPRDLEPTDSPKNGRPVDSAPARFASAALPVGSTREDIPEFKGLEGMALLAEHGIWVGGIEVWAGDRLVYVGKGLSSWQKPEAA